MPDDFMEWMLTILFAFLVIGLVGGCVITDRQTKNYTERKCQVLEDAGFKAFLTDNRNDCYLELDDTFMIEVDDVIERSNAIDD